MQHTHVYAESKRASHQTVEMHGGKLQVAGLPLQLCLCSSCFSSCQEVLRPREHLKCQGFSCQWLNEWKGFNQWFSTCGTQPL